MQQILRPLVQTDVFLYALGFSSPFAATEALVKDPEEESDRVEDNELHYWPVDVEYHCINE